MGMAIIYTYSGKYEQALDKLEYLMSIEFWATPTYLRADPQFAPLRELPRFEKILSEFESQASS